MIKRLSTHFTVDDRSLKSINRLSTHFTVYDRRSLKLIKRLSTHFTVDDRRSLKLIKRLSTHFTVDDRRSLKLNESGMQKAVQAIPKRLTPTLLDVSQTLLSSSVGRSDFAFTC